MNKIQQVLEENEECLNDFSWYSAPHGLIRVTGIDDNGLDHLLRQENMVELLHSSQLRLIEAFKEMVREKMLPERQRSLVSQDWFDSWNDCCDAIISELGSINEIKRNKTK